MFWITDGTSGETLGAKESPQIHVANKRKHPASIFEPTPASGSAHLTTKHKQTKHRFQSFSFYFCLDQFYICLHCVYKSHQVICSRTPAFHIEMRMCCFVLLFQTLANQTCVAKEAPVNLELMKPLCACAGLVITTIMNTDAVTLVSVYLPSIFWVE